MKATRSVNVVVSSLLGLAITACLPPPPGMSVKILPTSTDCVAARNEVVDLLSRWGHELIYAPDPRYSGDVSKFKFEGNWSNFDNRHRLSAVARIGDYPDLGLGVGLSYDIEDCELLVGLGYSKLTTDPKKKFGETEKKYAYELLSLLKEHYGESRLKDVRMTKF